MKTRRAEVSGQLRLIVPALMVLLLIPIATVHAVTFSAPQRFTATIDNDQQPELLQAADGTGWLFWHTSTFFNPGNQDIHYRTYDGSSWGPEQPLVTHPKQDVAPSAAQLPNGTIFLSFASNRTTGDFNIFLKRYNPGSGWTAEAQVTTDANDEVVSSLVGASDGKLWLFFDRKLGSDNNVFYKTYTQATGWSAESAVTTNTLPDRQPTAFQARDGKIWIAWARTMDAQLKKINIYYRTYTGGTPSSEISRTTGNTVDRHPELFQDSEGAIWFLWARELQITGTTFQDDLFYVSSTDNGSSWSVEAKLTNDGSNELDDIHATMNQLRDHRLWVFWASDRNDDNFWDIHYSNSSPLPSHDVAVTGVSSTPLKLRRGGPVTITVTVENKGTFTETFQVTVSAANTTTITVGAQSVTLLAGASQALTFTWSTGTVAPAKYRISASAAAVPGESPVNLNDNSLNDGTVWLLPPGDVDLDGDVDIIDASTIAIAYGSTAGPPPSPTWNPNADIDGNGRVDITDAAIMALWFGTQT